MNDNNSEAQAPLLYGDPNRVVNGEQQPIFDNVFLLKKTLKA